MKNKKGLTLLGWAITFLVIAVVAALLGFGAVAGVSLTIGKWLAIIFLILFVVSVIAHYVKS
ncbi:MAG: DUF1328 domain-containing protein [Nanoarchaeota archaeon]